MGMRTWCLTFMALAQGRFLQTIALMRFLSLDCPWEMVDWPRFVSGLTEIMGPKESLLDSRGVYPLTSLDRCDCAPNLTKFP